jgi:RNA polymerase sigma factor (sigma-70 family)
MELGMSKFGITLTAKLRHADLWAAAKKMGSQSALARYLGVCFTTLNRWINLKDCPKCAATDFGRSPTQAQLDRIKLLEDKLFAVTGKLLDELFPPEIRNKEFWSQPKQIETTKNIEIRALTSQNRFLLPDPAQVVEEEDLKQVVHKYLLRIIQSLPSMPREVIKLRYGLGCKPQTCKEIGKKFRLSVSRVQQLESKALRKIQQRRQADIENEWHFEEMLDYVNQD